MQFISKFNKGIRFLFCVIDIFSKYAWVILNGLQKILDESNNKRNKIWVDKSSEFYNGSIKSWLNKNAIKMYSIHGKRKSVFPERFIRTLKKNIHKYMASIQKMYILII